MKAALDGSLVVLALLVAGWAIWQDIKGMRAAQRESTTPKGESHGD